MLYLALGYFLAYIPYALLAKALSSGIVPEVDAPIGGLVLLAPEVAERTHCLDATGDISGPSVTSLDEHRRMAGIIRQAVRRRLAEHSVVVA